MSHQPAPQHPGTLEEARTLSAAWRNLPNRARKIPAELWNVAVSLCGQHSICKVSNILRLNLQRPQSACKKIGTGSAREDLCRGRQAVASDRSGR